MNIRSKNPTIPELLKECKQPSNVLLHLMFLRKHQPMQVEELWAQQKGVTKWSLGSIGTILQKLEHAGLARCEAKGWIVGPVFDASDDAKAAEVARELIKSYDRPRIVQKVTDRHDAIINLVASRGRQPASATDLFNQLQDSCRNLRTLQRDLVELEKQGLVSRNDDGWMAGLELLDDRFEDRARAAALRLLVDSFEGAVPTEIQKSLKQPLAKARKKLDSLPPTDPKNRWLEAIRIVPGHHELDDPVIRPDIKDAVEDAILQRTKIRITGRETQAFDSKWEFAETGSISHYLLEMPARPAIIFWPDGADRPLRIQLQDIESAELVSGVNATASWPKGYEPALVQTGMGFYSGDHASHGGESLFVLRVKDDAMKRLKSRRLGGRLKIVRPDGEGWTIVSFRALGDVPLYEYLRDLKGVVILRPFWFWKFASLDHSNAMRNYKDAFDLVQQYKIEEDREHKENDRCELEADGVNNKVQ
jgi:hypothetical protein